MAGMQIGVKGKQYGLSRPAGISFFNNVDDEDEGTNVSKVIQKTSAKKAQKQSQQDQAKVLAEDPTAYDYDSVYDSMHKSRAAAPAQKKQQEAARRPRYIHALLEKAAIRNKEQDIIYSRMLQKERETEGDLYAGKEKFLTSSYKKQLQENKLWQEEEDRRAALEEDVTSKEDLGSFYVNLLTRNEAYGGVSNKKDNSDERGSAEENTTPKTQSSASKAARNTEDKKITTTDTADITIKDTHWEETADKSKGGKDDKSKSSVSRDDTNKADVQQKGVKRSEHHTQEVGKQDQAPNNEPKEQPAPKLARGRDDAAVNAARERYLQRKAQTQP